MKFLIQCLKQVTVRSPVAIIIIEEGVAFDYLERIGRLSLLGCVRREEQCGCLMEKHGRG